MADDRMKNQDQEKNMGAGGEKNYGQQTPGRSRDDDEEFGKRGGGQGTSGRDMEDEDLDSERGGRSQSGGMRNQGGQGGQNR